MTKVCNACGTDFEKTWTYGSNKCRPCDRLAQKVRRNSNPDAYRAMRRKHTAKPLTKQRKQNYDLLVKYGISFDEKAAILASQGGKCAICGTDDSGTRLWHLDHDHLTGAIRGVLCCNCNMLLGHAKDTIEILEKGISYLSQNAPQLTLV